MKTILISVCLIIVNTEQISYRQYIPVNPVLLRPIPTSEQLNSICNPNSNVSFACGQNGTLVRRFGISSPWVACSSSTDHDLNGIDFSDKYNGIAVGKNGTIIRTTDSGNSWQQCRSKTVRELFDIVFSDNETAFACGLGGTILKTINSGISWIRNSTGTNDPLFCVDFFNEQFGCAGSFNSVYLTSDSGMTWEKKQFAFSPPAQITGICMIDSLVIYASSNSPSGRFISTSDGGKNWNSVSLDLPLLFGGAVDLVTDIDFRNREWGTIVTGYGTILSTVDEGKTWTRDTTFRATFEKPFVMSAISECSGLMSICGGGGTIFESDDTCSGWRISSGGLRNIESAFFCSASTGYFGGEGGQIYKTTDSGFDWQLAGSTKSDHVASLLFTNETTGFAATSYGIERSTNGGAEWIVIHDNEIEFCALAQSGTAVFAAGGILDNGTSAIVCSHDLGNSWRDAYSGSEGFVTGISGTSDGLISASTSFGRVLLSSDMGASWSVTFATDEKANCVAFKNKLTGFAGSTDGYVLKTTNGGATWEPGFTGSSKDVHSLCILNDVVIGAGEGGHVVASEDDGFSWQELEKISSNNINSVIAVDEKSAMCFGDFGTVIGYEIPIKAIPDVSVKGDDPEILLITASPNPLTLETNILAEATFESIDEFRLDLFDMTGRKVNVRFTSHKLNDKIHSKLYANELSTGIYFCKITAGAETAIIKLLKIR